ncbi:glycerol-3-phosphate responsive antiterminator [Lachnospiraceae bacterium ZAX-1]
MSMTMDYFMESTEICPVIAAVKNEEWLEACLKSDCQIVYLLYGDICNVADIVERIAKTGKKAIVHIDLIAGLAVKEICVDFIKKYTKADGIISMKASLIKRAKELNLFAIQRFFMMDFITFQNIKKYVKSTDPDVVEFLPSGLPKIIGYLLEDIDKPIVVSGLIMDKEDVMGALKSGAIAISTTNRALWDC